MINMETNQRKPSLFKRVLLWLFSWRTARGGMIVIAGLITLGALLITEENWRAKRDWEGYQRELELKGQRVDLAAVIPALAPDDQNFFAAPIVARILNPKSEAGSDRVNSQLNPLGRNAFDLYRGDPNNWPKRGSWQTGQLTDLKSWQHYFRTLAESPADKTNAFPIPPQPQSPGADILLSLREFDPMIEELRKAGQRPYSRLAIDYENGFEVIGEIVPYLSTMKACGQLLQLRAIAELADGQSTKALEDVKLMLRVTDSLRNQPFLITHLVRLAMVAITLQPVYEGIAKNEWSDAQLAELERELAKLDLLADHQTAMRGELAFAIDSLERQRITREYKMVDDSSGTNRIVTISLRFTPSAFFYQNELALARMYQEYDLPLFDLKNRTVSPAQAQKAETSVSRKMKHPSPYQMLALMIRQAINKSVVKFAICQNAVDLTRTGCALERFRLTHGAYPDSLEMLSPQFMEKLPHDLITGQPLHYRRQNDGRFLLYSVGWNQKDDGGTIVRKKGSTSEGDPNQGDWVWPTPAL